MGATEGHQEGDLGRGGKDVNSEESSNTRHKGNLGN